MSINFRSESYFPWHVKFVAVVLGVVGGLLLFQYEWLGIFILVGCAAVLTSHYGVAIDPSKKLYCEYVWLLGIRTGSDKSFSAIEYIFIKPNRQTQTMNLRAISSDVTKDVFDAYLKFSESEKIHLLTLESKTALIKKVKTLAVQLDVKVLDYSSGEAIVV